MNGGSTARGGARHARGAHADMQPRIAGKHCPVCRTYKPPTEFHRDPSNSDMLHSCCRVCKRERKRNNRQMTKDAVHLLDMMENQTAAGGGRAPQAAGEPAHAKGVGGAPRQPVGYSDVAVGDPGLLLAAMVWNPATQAWQLLQDASPAASPGDAAAVRRHAHAAAAESMRAQSRGLGRAKRGGRKAPPPSAADSAMRARVIESFRMAAQPRVQPEAQDRPAKKQCQSPTQHNPCSLPGRDSAATSDIFRLACCPPQMPLQSPGSAVVYYSPLLLAPAVQTQQAALGRGIRTAQPAPVHETAQQWGPGGVPTPGAGHASLEAQLLAAAGRGRPHVGGGMAVGPTAVQAGAVPVLGGAVSRCASSAAVSTRACLQCGAVQGVPAEQAAADGSAGLCKLCIMASVLCASKYCGSCYEHKEVHDFDEDTSTSDGLQEYCKECMHVPEEEDDEQPQPAAAGPHWARGGETRPTHWPHLESGPKRDEADLVNSRSMKCVFCDETKASADFQTNLATFDRLAPVCWSCEPLTAIAASYAAAKLEAAASQGPMPLPDSDASTDPHVTAEASAESSGHDSCRDSPDQMEQGNNMVLLHKLGNFAIPWLMTRHNPPSSCST